MFISAAHLSDEGNQEKITNVIFYRYVNVLLLLSLLYIQTLIDALGKHLIRHTEGSLIILSKDCPIMLPKVFSY